MPWGSRARPKQCAICHKNLRMDEPYCKNCYCGQCIEKGDFPNGNEGPNERPRRLEGHLCCQDCGCDRCHNRLGRVDGPGGLRFCESCAAPPLTDRAALVDFARQSAAQQDADRRVARNARRRRGRATDVMLPAQDPRYAAPPPSVPTYAPQNTYSISPYDNLTGYGQQSAYSSPQQRPPGRSDTAQQTGYGSQQLPPLRRSETAQRDPAAQIPRLSPLPASNRRRQRSIDDEDAEEEQQRRRIQQNRAPSPRKPDRSDDENSDESSDDDDQPPVSQPPSTRYRRGGGGGGGGGGFVGTLIPRRQPFDTRRLSRFHIPKIATTMGIARQMTILGLTICRMTPRSQARGRVLHVRQSIITVRNDIFGLAVVH